ncbi:MAG: bifunctional tetrahydrofolate synthase/dihydrofolate synthase [Buchnera aphidicola (Pentalonia nigronervosa)]|jgi:dihydrofolate synthase/folylpolyglutamate synthase|uniref:Dihydrofolate synthase/folylpolyglutamate synthase n=1 Tax=Buchnera aphidicola (Pentalonia nigronervosa) TaxID=1309793 RepID=A0A7H1AZI9_9GAMM|nr:MAG: bifunctional tetrahydrofolate synthase/dihydrofolate synthase [Buchnera aphidicola (Pentalonia nigronervosa)]
MLDKNSSLLEWLKYLETFPKKKRFDLIELKNFAIRLKILNIESFIFTVGGTNGKGTTCIALEKLLLKSGYTVGLYTSPHLINYTERVRINGKIIAEDQHVLSFCHIETKRNAKVLTYFEFVTISALFLFKQYKLDVLILEVGLGGRLDATNIVDSDLSIITNIEMDHTSILGNDRSSIVREKSGIFRKNTISVIGDYNVPGSIYKIAKKTHTVLKNVNIDWFWFKNDNSWDFIHPDIQLYNLPMTKIPLSNAAIALSALYYAKFKIHENIIRHVMPKIQLLGRFQTICFDPRIILDVAHNPHAVLYLSYKIDEISCLGKIHAVIGVLKDKDISQMIRILKNRVHYWYAAPLNTNRTISVMQLKNYLPKHNTYFFNSIAQAGKTAYMRSEKQDVILIFGSFFTVSEFITSEFFKNKIININLEDLCY